jgi:serine/threonine protein kinase
VFGAYDRDNGQAVVVHVMRIPADQAEDRVRVAQALTGVKHPFLVAVLEVGRQEEAVFIVTEAVGSARTLDQVLKARSPEPREAAQWIAEVAEAIQHAHTQGLQRFDVKAVDIAIKENGHALLADLSSWFLGMANPPEVYGNPAYLAPECCEGQGASGDLRRVVYSLGVVLYQTLTGSLPYQGGWIDLIRRILAGQPRPPRAVRRSIPKELEEICLKAMARKPEDRYATPGELAQALRQFSGGASDRRRSFWRRA